MPRIHRPIVSSVCRCAAAVALLLAANHAFAREEQGNEEDPEFEAEMKARYELLEQLHRVAFDPKWYFLDEFAKPDIQIRYRGDDTSVPVWSMRIAEGSLSDRGDWQHWRARLLRAGGPDEAERPRSVGYDLWGRAYEYRKKHPQADIRHLLDHMNLEWLETDTASCPPLREGLKKIPDIKWTTPFVQSESSDPDTYTLIVIAHADTVSVKFRNLALIWHAEYQGSIDDGNPADWADRLRKAMKQCWKAASVPVPWRAWRKVEKDGRVSFEPVQRESSETR